MDTMGQEPGNANLFSRNFLDVPDGFFPAFALPTKRKYSSDVSENHTGLTFWFFPSAKGCRGVLGGLHVFNCFLNHDSYDEYFLGGYCFSEPPTYTHIYFKYRGAKMYKELLSMFYFSKLN